MQTKRLPQKSTHNRTVVSEKELRKAIAVILREFEKDLNTKSSRDSSTNKILEVGGYYVPNTGTEEFRKAVSTKYEPAPSPETPEEREKREKREQIARGQIPVGVKLAIETDGEPMAVKVGYATYMGNKIPIGIVYSKAKYGFNPIGKYGSLIPVNYILYGIWEYPDRFAPVTDRLAQAGNKDVIKKLEEEGVNLETEIFAKAPALKKKVAAGDAQAFYDVSKMFVLNETKGTWLPPIMRSTAAGIERSQSYKCAMSKREFGKEIINFGVGKYLDHINSRSFGILGYITGKSKFYADEDMNRIAPCFAAVADSLVYDIAAAIVGAMVSAVATPAAGMGTYAILQVTPMVPVLMWHIQSKNWQGVIFYIVRMIAAIYGGASQSMIKQIAAAVVEILASLASEMGYSFSDAEQNIVLAWFTGKTISQAEALAAQIKPNDPLGLVSLYPNL